VSLITHRRGLDHASSRASEDAGSSSASLCLADEKPPSDYALGLRAENFVGFVKLAWVVILSRRLRDAF